MTTDKPVTKDAQGVLLPESRRYWDRQAPSFDDKPDHGLTDPVVLNTWTRLLKRWSPPPPAGILDIGCGTGSLAVVLAGLGYEVTGIDLSPAMISRAESKAAAAGANISFHVMDAAYPVLPGQRFAGILCRHLLWLLPELSDVLQYWTGLLVPGGRLLLVEGFWHTGGGLHAEDLVAARPPTLTEVMVEDLSLEAGFWGRKVEDERYAIMAALE